MRWILLFALAACAAHPGKNEVRGSGKTEFVAHVTSATFDGKLVRMELGPRVRVVIARCYAHAQQQIGDADHVAIQLDGTGATAGELAIADCTTKHVVASLWAMFADGTKLEASIDSDLAHVSP